MTQNLDDGERRRLAEVRRHEIVGTGPDSRFDRIVSLAATSLGVPISLISFLDNERHWVKASIGLDARQMPRELGFLPDIGRDEILVISEPELDSRLADSALIAGDNPIRFFAAVPVKAALGQPLGMLCVMDRKRRNLSDDDRKTLTTLAAVVSDLVELHRVEIDAGRQQPMNQQASRQLGPILNLIPSLVIVIDPSGRTIEANAAALELAGATLRELGTRPIWEWRMWSYIPDAHKKIRDAVSAAAAGASAHYDALIKSQSGALVTVDILMTPTFNHSAEVEFIVVSGIDISSRLAVEEHLRESEKRFRGTFENAAVGMAHVSLDGRWLRFNEVLLETLGYSQEEFLQTSLPELSHPDDLPGHLLQFGRLKSGEIDRYSREKRYVKKDGQFLWVNVTASLQRSEFGEPLYAILVIEDIAFRKEAERRQRLLVGELSHRVKNIMAMVQSIANQSLKSNSESEVYVNAFRARLQSMAHAHDLLTQESWQRADFAALVQSQATINGVIEKDRVKVEGPPLMLHGQVALNLALVIHELASNALRHGSLSLPDGRVVISWTIDHSVSPKVVDIVWRECDGPPVQTPERLGFGTRLIERSLKRGLGADVNVDWESDGLVVRIRLPVPEIAHEDYFTP